MLELICDSIVLGLTIAILVIVLFGKYNRKCKNAFYILVSILISIVVFAELFDLIKYLAL